MRTAEERERNPEAWAMRFRLAELTWVILHMGIGLRSLIIGPGGAYGSWTWVLLSAYFAALLGMDVAILFHREEKAVRRLKLYWLACCVLSAVFTVGRLLLERLPGEFLLLLTPYFSLSPMFVRLLHGQLALPVETALFRCLAAALLLSGMHFFYYLFLFKGNAGKERESGESMDA